LQFVTAQLAVFVGIETHRPLDEHFWIRWATEAPFRTARAGAAFGRAWRTAPRVVGTAWAAVTVTIAITAAVAVTRGTTIAVTPRPAVAVTIAVAAGATITIAFRTTVPVAVTRATSLALGPAAVAVGAAIAEWRTRAEELFAR
jgi:hypothetical protein